MRIGNRRKLGNRRQIKKDGRRLLKLNKAGRRLLKLNKDGCSKLNKAGSSKLNKDRRKLGRRENLNKKD